jgi:hypothetical protein
MARLGLTTGQRLRDIFLEKGEVNPWSAYQQLKETSGFRGSYGHVLRLFYACRAIGLIEFSREEESTTPIAKRYHRIVPGFENDPRWFTPHAELYPAAGMGGLKYVRGSSGGRSKEYET